MPKSSQQQSRLRPWSLVGWGRRSQWQPWLQLVRLPNLLTVPGDPLAGALLAAAVVPTAAPTLHALLAVCMISICLYAYGLVANDLHDLAEDRRLRPERPLPRQEISLRQARTLAWLLLLTSLVVAVLLGSKVLLNTAVLALTVAGYNRICKHNRLRGAIAMGACRGLSLLLGAALVGWPLIVLPAALGLALYIGAVTWIADAENEVAVFTHVTWIPALTLAVTTAIVVVALASVTEVALLPTLLALALALLVPIMLGRRLYSAPSPPEVTRRAIGLFILSLTLWQATYLVAVAAYTLAVLVVAAGLLARFLRRYLAMS